jgi:hypothetical protein
MVSLAPSRRVLLFVVLLLLNYASSLVVPYGSVERVKKMGYGNAVEYRKPFELFNPAEEGKLQRTGHLEERIKTGARFDPFTFKSLLKPAYLTSFAPPPSTATVLTAQHFLEYLDHDGSNNLIAPPTNTYKNSAPATATILASAPIIGGNAPGDIRHVIMRLPEDFKVCSSFLCLSFC